MCRWFFFFFFFLSSVSLRFSSSDISVKACCNYLTRLLWWSFLYYLYFTKFFDFLLLSSFVVLNSGFWFLEQVEKLLFDAPNKSDDIDEQVIYLQEDRYVCINTQQNKQKMWFPSTLCCQADIILLLDRQNIMENYLNRDAKSISPDPCFFSLKCCV